MQEIILKTQSLTKRYGNTVAVDSVNLTINRGDIYGFIGNNGAGKTTFMRCILGLAHPDSGQIELFPSESGTTELKRRKIGSLIEAPGIFGDCSAKENLMRFGKLTHCSLSEAEGLLELVGLANVGKKRAGKFSLGMKQRLGIAISLLGNPEFMVLDEPINGLDPEGIKEIRELILRLNREKKVTFLISSHMLEELNKIATKFGIINHGRLVEEISAVEAEKLTERGIEFRVSDATAATTILNETFPSFGVKLSDNILVVDAPVSAAAKINYTLVTGGVEVFGIKEKKSEIERFFLERMGK